MTLKQGAGQWLDSSDSSVTMPPMVEPETSATPGEPKRAANKQPSVTAMLYVWDVDKLRALHAIVDSDYARRNVPPKGYANKSDLARMLMKLGAAVVLEMAANGESLQADAVEWPLIPGEDPEIQALRDQQVSGGADRRRWKVPSHSTPAEQTPGVSGLANAMRPQGPANPPKDPKGLRKDGTPRRSKGKKAPRRGMGADTREEREGR